MISIYLLLDCEGAFEYPPGFPLALMMIFFENPPVLPYP